MAVAVVDLFEPVDVQQRRGQARGWCRWCRLVRQRLGCGAFVQAGQRVAPVGQPCQRVAAGQHRELLKCLMQLITLQKSLPMQI
jgi:hypothetical protein